jgi:hypothetical protein
MLTTLVLLCSVGTTDCGSIVEAPDQTESPFMCLQYRMEEVPSHPVPDGKYVKVQCVPRIIE